MSHLLLLKIRYLFHITDNKKLSRSELSLLFNLKVMPLTMHELVSVGLNKFDIECINALYNNLRMLEISNKKGIDNLGYDIVKLTCFPSN